MRLRWMGIGVFGLFVYLLKLQECIFVWVWLIPLPEILTFHVVLELGTTGIRKFLRPCWGATQTVV